MARSDRSAPARPRRATDHLLVRIGLAWAANALALLAADAIVRDVVIEPETRVIVAGAVFGLVNWLVKPVVKLLALPLIVITLGIVLFFINLLMLYLTSWIVGGFDVNSFGGAIGATIILWVVNGALHALFGIGHRGEHRRGRRSRR